MAEDDFSDLVELGIDLSESDSLTIKFDKAAKHMQSLAGNLNNETLLEMYSYYKQSLEGSCNVPKPSWYDVRNKAKWEAWNKLGDMSRNEAKNLYIQGVKKIDTTFDLDGDNATESWVKVSCLNDSKLVSRNKNISDHIREGNTEEVRKYLEKNLKEINSLDSEGLGLIHYAADIGSTKIIELLVTNKADVNLKDAPQGQTALHYAASCGYKDCVQLLLKIGANKSLPDIDGETAEMVAADVEIKELLK